MNLLLILFNYQFCTCTIIVELWEHSLFNNLLSSPSNFRDWVGTRNIVKNEALPCVYFCSYICIVGIRIIVVVFSLVAEININWFFQFFFFLLFYVWPLYSPIGRYIVFWFLCVNKYTHINTTHIAAAHHPSTL